MLASKKDELGRGKFDEWVKTYCKFGRAMAYNYMKAAESSNAVRRFETVRQALGYESMKPGHKPQPKAETNSPKGAVPVVNPKGTGETGNDRPAAPPTPAASATPSPPPSEGEPERPDDLHDDELLARTEAEVAASVEKVMQADDKLAAAYAEIKRQAAEIATLKISRDGYMNRANELTRLLKKEQSKVTAIEKKMKRAA
jgi:hypothetical protein